MPSNFIKIYDKNLIFFRYSTELYKHFFGAISPMTPKLGFPTQVDFTCAQRNCDWKSYPQFKDDNVRFTIIPLKPYLMNKVEDIVIFLGLKCFILIFLNGFPTVEMRKSLL